MADAADIQAAHAAREIVRDTVAAARRLADERGLDAGRILQNAAFQLDGFAFGVAVTGVEPEEFLEPKSRTVRFADPT